ncbi:hypothetical protein BDAP_000676 [Binucleata daphniae]
MSLFTLHYKTGVLCSNIEDEFISSIPMSSDQDGTKPDHLQIQENFNSLTNKRSVLLFLNSVKKEDLNKIINKANIDKNIETIKKNIEQIKGLTIDKSTLDCLNAISKFSTDHIKYFDAIIKSLTESKSIEKYTTKKHYYEYLKACCYNKTKYREKVIEMLLQDTKTITSKSDFYTNISLERHVFTYFINEKLIEFVELQNNLEKNTGFINDILTKACSIKNNKGNTNQNFAENFYAYIKDRRVLYEKELDNKANEFLDLINKKEFEITYNNNKYAKKLSESKFASIYDGYIRKYMGNLKTEIRHLINEKVKEIDNQGCDEQKLTDYKNELTTKYKEKIKNQNDDIEKLKINLQLQIFLYNETYALFEKTFEPESSGDTVKLDPTMLLNSFISIGSEAEQQIVNIKDLKADCKQTVTDIYENYKAQRPQDDKLNLEKLSQKENITKMLKSMQLNAFETNTNITMEANSLITKIIKDTLEDTDVKAKFDEVINHFDNTSVSEIVFVSIICANLTKTDQEYKEFEKKLVDGQKIYIDFYNKIAEKFVEKIKKLKEAVTENKKIITEVENNLKEFTQPNTNDDSREDMISQLVSMLGNGLNPDKNYKLLFKIATDELVTHLFKTMHIFNDPQNLNVVAVDNEFITSKYAEMENESNGYKAYLDTIKNKIEQELQQNAEKQIKIKDDFTKKLAEKNELDENLATDTKNLMQRILLLAVLGDTNAVSVISSVKSLLETPTKIDELQYAEIRKSGKYDDSAATNPQETSQTTVISETPAENPPKTPAESQNEGQNTPPKEETGKKENKTTKSKTKDKPKWLKYTAIIGSIVFVCCSGGSIYFICINWKKRA